MEVNGECRLCQGAMESRDHFFFSCSYSKEVWCSILQLCGLSRRVRSWSEELAWAIMKLRGKALLSIVMRLAWRASIYYIWRERNRRMHGQIPDNAAKIVEQVKKDIRFRTISLKNIVNDPVNCSICSNWGLKFV